MYYIFLFIINILLEEIVCFFMKYRKLENFIGVLCVNMITHPAMLLFTYIFYKKSTDIIIILILEVFIILVEWKLFEYMYRRIDLKLLLLSFMMNITSYLFGVLFL